jgi:hypothetical protein
MPAGSRPGERRGGRAAGTPNRATLEKQLRAATGIQAAHHTGKMPLDVILQRMADPASVSRESFEAAVAAAPYVHARLTSVAASVTASDAPHAGALAAYRSLTTQELHAMRSVLLGAQRRVAQEHDAAPSTSPPGRTTGQH